MSRLLVRGHLGMGDHLITNGLIRELVAAGEDVTIPCYSKNAPAVEAMYADLGYGKVETVWPSHEDFERTLHLGFYRDPRDMDVTIWDQEFYRHAGIPFEKRWSSFKIAPSAIPRPRKALLHRFIHDDPRRGFVIPINYGYRPAEASTIFRFLPEIMAAEEIHCINSSFAILADSMKAPGRKFLHKYARPDGSFAPSYQCDWEILTEPLP